MLDNKPSLRNFLVRKRLEWVGHVWQAEDSLIKKITTISPRRIK
jgi:hypothetical protein